MRINPLEKFRNKSFNEQLLDIFFITGALLIVVFIIEFFVNWFTVQPNSIYNNPVFQHNLFDRYMDFFNITYFASTLDPYNSSFASSYPPLNFVFSFFFILISWMGGSNVWASGSVAARATAAGLAALGVYFALTAAAFTFIIIRVQRKFKLSWKTTALLTLLLLISSPVLFAVERGNYVFIVLFFTSLFLLDYNSEKRVLRELSLVWLAVATAMRLYPAIFIILLLKEKRFADTLKTAVYSLLLFFLPFFIFNGGFVYNVKSYFANTVTFSGYELLSINVSIVNVFKLVWSFFSSNIPSALTTVGTVFSVLLLVLSCVACFLTKDKWKIITLLCVLCATVPNPSKINALVFVFPAVVAFVAAEHKNKLDILYAVLLLLIVTPVQFGYYIAPTSSTDLGVSVGCVIESFACIVLLIALNVDIFVDFFKRRTAGKRRRKFPNNQFIS
jgi:hypothetical protein